MAHEVEIKVSDLSPVALEPGDTLVVRTPFSVSKAIQAEIREELWKYFPGHPVIVMGGDVTLSVVRPSSTASAK